MAETLSGPDEERQPGPSVPPRSLLKTLGQQRAAFAWACLEEVALGEREGYTQFASSIPAMIHTNGLGQAVAFMMIQTGGKRLLLTHLQAWLCGLRPGGIQAIYPMPPGNPSTLSQAIFEGDSQTLRRATVEAQALLVWIKRFSKAQPELGVTVAPNAASEEE